MFEGKLVRIRAVEQSDVANAWEWVNNPEITRFLSMSGQLISRTSETELMERLSLGDDPFNRVFSIETLTGDYIGSCGLHSIDPINRHAELGIVIGKPEYLGKGYGSDAMQVLLRTAFHVLNLNKVYLMVISGNTRAIRSYQKCGFKEVVRYPHHCYIDGEWYDDLVMELLRLEWEAERGQA